MKRLAVVACIGVLALGNIAPAYAQGIALGPVVGINVATLSIEDEETDVDPRTGLRAGAHLSFGLSPQFGVILEAVYSQKGATARDEDVDIGLNINYVEFPVLAQFLIPTNQAGTAMVHLAAGPTVSLEVGCKLSGEDDGTSVTIDCDELLDTKNVDLGVTALGGIGIQAGPGRIIFDVAFDFGLSDINDDTGGNSIKHRNLYFQAGYEFPMRPN